MNDDGLTHEQFLALVPYKGDLEGWVIWDYRGRHGWKFCPEGNGILSYFIDPATQIMSTLSREPVFTGDFFSEDFIDERQDHGDYVVLLDRREKILTILDAKDEIKTDAWWLFPKHRFSTDWNTAEWRVIP